MKKLALQVPWKSYLKNKDDFRALLLREYPTFVYRKVVHLAEGEIPVFTFHSVEARRLESQLQYLRRNNYVTLSAQELYEIITKREKAPPNAVVLTFDDGLGSLWSIAYPLLQKYGFCAISFIVPFWIRESAGHYPNLSDVWEGQALFDEVDHRERNVPLCTWHEIREMSHSRVIEFQSHSSFHHSIYVSGKIVDFINPSLQPSFLCSYLNPMIRVGGKDEVYGELEWGHPIYEWAPALSGRTRYIEDEGLTEVCIEYVKRAGNQALFKQAGWRRKLMSLANDFRRKNGNGGCYETEVEKRTRILDDLAGSKKAIEEQLKTQVTHLCYPWYCGSQLAVELSRHAGFVANHWGILDKRASAGVGCDPYYIGRMSDDYVFALPGKGRMALLPLLLKKVLFNAERILRNTPRFGNRL